MKRIIITIGVSVSILFFANMAVASNPNTPPGQDGSCRGANMATCRPDPQPSHGHDCDHPNGNPNGNDDHCNNSEEATPSASSSGSEEPTPSMTATPSATPVATMTATPVATPTDTTTTTPRATPTATSTAMTTATPRASQTVEPSVVGLPNTAYRKP